MNTLILTRQQIQQKREEAATLFEQDLSNSEIARRIGINRSSVSGWYQLWQAQGKEGLQLHTPGRTARLSAEQVQQVLQALLQGPEAHGFPTPLWTLARIAQVIAKETRVQYNFRYVAELLHQWNWSAQKPEAVAKERDEAEIAHWKAEEWPRIKKGREAGGQVSLPGGEWILSQIQCAPHLGSPRADPAHQNPLQLEASECDRLGDLSTRWQRSGSAVKHAAHEHQRGRCAGLPGGAS